MNAEQSRTAAIISIGDELTTGQSLDTNSRWLSRQLTDQSYTIVEHTTVPDNTDHIAGTFKRLAASASLIIATGGLGPTKDDLSRDALALLLGESLITDPQALEDLKRIFSTRGRKLTEANKQQALRPPSATCLANDRGTAPGLATNYNNTKLFILPGPPFENQPMFERSVLTQLPQTNQQTTIHVIQHFGIPESAAAAKLGDILDRDRDPIVGITASDGVISCRIRCTAPPQLAAQQIKQTDDAINAAIGEFRVGISEKSLAERVLEDAHAANTRIRVAESCTAGLLGAALTAVPGASKTFEAGWQTYSNEAKSSLLHIDPNLFKHHGAVSEPVAKELAINAASAQLQSPAHPNTAALSITGVAGPAGGSQVKPVGTVFIGCARIVNAELTHAEVRQFKFPGDRNTIRNRAVQAALAMLLYSFRTNSPQEFLWQIPSQTS